MSSSEDNLAEQSGHIFSLTKAVLGGLPVIAGAEPAVDDQVIENL